MVTHASFQLLGPRERQEDSFLCSPRVFAVADGLGGHPNGDLASKAAIAAAAASEPLACSIVTAAQAAVEQVPRGFHRRTPGTTLTGLVFSESAAVLFHIGDSRCYRLRGGQLEQLSADHSDYYGCLTRRLGVCGAGESVADFTELELQSGDTFLLCTDGLYGCMRDEAIRDVLGMDVEAAAKELMAAADGVCGDNVTGIVVRYGG